MKKLILTLSLAAIAVAPLALRAEDPKPEPPKREGGGPGRPGGPGGPGGGGRMNPEERLKRMTETLGLSQEQQDKVKAVMEENRGKFEEIRALPEDQRRDKMRELFAAQQEKINAILTPEQQEKYKAEMEKRRQQGGGPGGPGGPGGRRGEGGPKADGEKKPEGGKPDDKK